MGGMGSGDWFRWDTKTAVEETLRIDIRSMKKQGMLTPGYAGTFSWTQYDKPCGSIQFRMGTESITLIYRVRRGGDDWQSVREVVPLDRTSCNYGGERLWFLCPHCFRRVAVLCEHGGRFLCRHCHDLPYRSQQETRLDRMYRKTRKIRTKLGVSPNLCEPVIWKPKGMHQKTFDRLRKQEKAANDEASFELAVKAGFVDFLGRELTF